MKPSLAFPVKPLATNQVFGANPEYYAKFPDSSGNPQKGHPGIDLRAFHGQPVYAAHDGIAIYLKDGNGGEGIYNYGNGFVTIHWHLVGNTDSLYPPPIPFDNAYHSVQAGDLIGYADNTGAPIESSGDHLHFGLAFTDAQKQFTNKDNGFNGCVDPASYWSGTFAQDIPKSLTYIKYLFGVATTLLGLRSKPLTS